MPYFSYHGGHSGQYCRHAKDSLRAVVLRAIEQGFTHYGLSEHCPRDRAQDLYDDEDGLSPSDLARLFEDYAREARQLQEEFAGDIELLVGLETERLPPSSWAGRMGQLRDRIDADYLVGSVHEVDGTWVDYSAELTAEAAEACGGVEALRVRYFDALTELVTTLRPEVVGHLDLVRRFDGHELKFTRTELAAATATLEAAREVGAVLDVNAGPARRGFGPVYPSPELLTLACEMDVGVTLGDDSHGVDAVGVGLDACLAAIAAAGYQRVHYLGRVDGETTLLDTPLEAVVPSTGQPITE